VLLIDTDNALGSPCGDVDDGLAIAALLKSGLPIAAIASVSGNTSEERAFRNNQALGALCGYPGPYLRGIDAGSWPVWESGTLQVAALGPLTNLAAALAARGGLSVSEVVLVGGNTRSRGRWPPFWPHEFNLTKDRAATRAVFASDLPLTVVPLDVARRLRVGPREIAELEGPLGDLLRRHSRRWLRRSRLVRGSASFPAFDLAAAAYLLDPESVKVEETRVILHRNAWVEFGRGKREVRVIRDLDRERIWRRFVGLVNEPPAKAPSAAPSEPSPHP
jgi:inosine-uridine nucleoside N-ribohydrolase